MPQNAMWSPVSDVRKKWPGLKDWTDDRILENLSDPQRFRSAFPEYQGLSDDVIRRNIAALRGTGAARPALAVSHRSTLPPLPEPGDYAVSGFEAADSSAALSLASDEAFGKVIGAASRVERAINEPIEYAVNFYGEKIDEGARRAIEAEQVSPEFAAKHPAIARAWARYNAWRIGVPAETAKVVSGLLLDPKNWPFLASGAANVRPAIQTAGTALFTVLQQKGAIEAVRAGDWSNAALQEGFALLGLRSLPGEVKAVIADAARAQARPAKLSDIPEPPKEVSQSESPRTKPAEPPADPFESGIPEPPPGIESPESPEPVTPSPTRPAGEAGRPVEASVAPAAASGITPEQLGWFTAQLPHARTFTGLEAEMEFGDYAHHGPKVLEALAAQGIIEPSQLRKGKKVVEGWRLTAKGQSLRQHNLFKEFPGELPGVEPPPSTGQTAIPAEPPAEAHPSAGPAPPAPASRPETERGAASTIAAVPPEKGAGDKGAQPKQETPVGARAVVLPSLLRGPARVAAPTKEQLGKVRLGGNVPHDAIPTGVSGNDRVSGVAEPWQMTADEYHRVEVGRVMQEYGVSREEADFAGGRSEWFDNLWKAAEAGKRIPDNVLDSLEPNARAQLIHHSRDVLRDYMPPDVRAKNEAERSAWDAQRKAKAEADAATEHARRQSAERDAREQAAEEAAQKAEDDAAREVRDWWAARKLSEDDIPLVGKYNIRAQNEAFAEWESARRRAVAEAVERGENVPQAIRREYADSSTPPSPAGTPADGVQKVSSKIGRDERVAEMPVSEIMADPARFQFRTELGRAGLENVKKFDPEMGGIIAVWRDPANGQVYVVNGHHRLELAKRTGYPSMLVRFIDAPDAVTARARGALMNIAEGNATAIEAAKYLRDSGTTPQELDAMGISLSGPVTRDAVALTKLSQETFDKVVRGDVKLKDAVAVGKHLEGSVADQMLADLAKRRKAGERFEEKAIEEEARFWSGELVHSTQDTLFGAEETTRAVAPEMGKLSANILKRLSADRRLFGFIANEGRAKEIEARTGSILQTDKATELANIGKEAEGAYRLLSQRGGVVYELLKDGARRIAEGEDAQRVREDTYTAISAEISRTFNRGEGERPGGSETVDRRRPPEAATAEPAGVGPRGVTEEPAAPRGVAEEPAKQSTAERKAELLDNIGKDLSDLFGTGLEFASTRGNEPFPLKLKELPPRIMRNLVELGYLHFKQGVQDFAAWSERMVHDLGAEITPYLQQVYNRVKEWHLAQRDVNRLANGNWFTKQLGKAYSYPFFRNAAAWLAVPKPKLLQIAANLNEDRINFINLWNYNARRLAWELKRSISPEEVSVEKMGYTLQGLHNADTLSPAAREGLAKIREYNQHVSSMLREIYGDELPLQDAETYLAQIWDLPADPGIRERATRTIIKDPFLKKKVVDNYQAGIEQFGLTPKYDNIADIIAVRANWAARAAGNYRIASLLRDFGLILTEAEHDRMAVNWPKAVDAKVLERATYAGQTASGETVLAFRPVRVHPDIEQAVNTIFGQRWTSPTFRAVNTVSQVSKRAILMASFFHHVALSEVSHGMFGLRHRDKAVKGTFVFNPDFYRGMKESLVETMTGKPGEPPVFRWKPEIVKDAIEHGLELDSTDRDAHIVAAARRIGLNQGPLGKVAGAPLRALGHVAHVFEGSLWQYFHQGQMLEAYHTLLADGLAKLGENATPDAVADLKRGITKVVNQGYGAENFERLLVEPKFQQGLQIALLAPKWTVSNIHMASKLIEKGTGARIGRRWVRNAAVAWFATTQMLNYALSSYYQSEDRHGEKGGHFTWDNPGAPMRLYGQTVPGMTENGLNISAGYNQDGTQRYIRFGKAFREMFLWLAAPWETLMGKLGTIPRSAAALVTGSEPGGYRVVDPQKPKWEQRAKVVADMMIPLQARDTLNQILHWADPVTFPYAGGSTQFMSQPTVRGLTMNRAIEAYTLAMQDERPDYARMVLQAARANHLNANAVVQAYKRTRRVEWKREHQRKPEYNRSGERTYPAPVVSPMSRPLPIPPP